MKKTLLVAAALLVAGPAVAQPAVPSILPNPSNDEIRAPRPPRQRGIPLTLALEAAEAANAACLANGAKTTTIVIDSEGVPIAMVSNDGAAAITQRIAMGKAMIALKIKDASGNGAKADPAIMANLGVPRAGGLPLMAGSDVVGAIAVSGSPTPPPDEACAKVGLAKIQDRIK